MATIEVYSRTAPTLKVYLAGLDPNYNDNRDGGARFVTWYIREAGGSWQAQYPQTTIPSGASSTISSPYEFAVAPGKTYEVDVSIINAYGSLEIPQAGGIAPLTGVKILLTSWSWLDSNGSATANQTYAAYLALAGKGAVSNFSYLVWNDLVNKVYECVYYGGVYWGTDGGVNGAASASYAAALMTANDKTLTASRFNAVRYNVGSRVATGVQPVQKGDAVLGSYFLAVTDALNTWISSINSTL